MSRYDVNSILESSTLPIGGAAKRLKEAEHAEIAMDIAQRTDDHDNMGSQLTDGISSFGAVQHGWPTVAFQQAQPFSMHYPYGQRLWCKQEQDSDNRSFQELHQLQLGNTHNFFQPSVLHNLVSMDSSSMEHSSGSNSVVYSSGVNDGTSTGTNGGYQGIGYGSSAGYAVPMATVISNNDNNHNQGNGYGDGEQVKALGYENMFSSSDPYHARNLHYLSQQPSAGGIKASAYDQGSACFNWVPTAVPTIAAARSNNMAVCHGAQPFTVWNDGT